MKNIFKVLLFVSLVLTNCGLNKPDVIRVFHFAGVIGLHVIYEIGDNNLIVKTNCDFKDCSERVVYERKLSVKETSQLISKIKSFKLDTLKEEYINPYVYDGLYTEIYFGELIGTSQKKVIVQNVDLALVDSIGSYIDDLILEKKYRFSTFGQE